VTAAYGMPMAWVPRLGDFDVTEEEIRFKGRRLMLPPPEGSPEGAESKEQASVGLILCNRTLADGFITAEVEFEQITDKTVCELAVAYDPNAAHLVTAGIGGTTLGMFGIREYGGPKTGAGIWWHHQASGERGALRPGRSYQIGAQFLGSSVTLSIDGVTVCAANVSTPSGRERQVGILTQGDHVITIRGFGLDSTKPKAFVVMQFGADYDDLYRDVVSKVCEVYEVSVLRADEVSGPGFIIADIVRKLRRRSS